MQGRGSFEQKRPIEGFCSSWPDPGVGDGGVGGRGQDLVGVRHAVLHRAVAAAGAVGHALEPHVAERDVGPEAKK